MFINYLVHQFFEFISLIHELSEFMTVHEQLMFMNKVRVNDQNKLLNSLTFMNVLFGVKEDS